MEILKNKSKDDSVGVHETAGGILGATSGKIPGRFPKGTADESHEKKTTEVIPRRTSGEIIEM